VAIRLTEIAQFIQGQLVGEASGSITGLSSLTEAGPQDLAYLASDRFLKAALSSKAAAVILNRATPELHRPQIVVGNPAYAFALIAQRYFCPTYRPRGIAHEVVRGMNVEIGPDPSIWPFVTLGDRVRLGARVTLYPGVFIGDDCVLGDDVLLYPNVTVREGCVLGNRVIVHSGTVIGSDGFGYVQHQGRHQKIPQLGTVLVEDDVELGANVSVDRASFGRTLIRKGTKVDNLVQIAHNVTIGEHSILVAQVGIAGSTTVGHHVMIGGQAGVADHIEIGDQVMIGARSGVNRNVSGNQIVSGAPVMPHETAIRAQAVIPRLPELRQQVRDLEGRVAALEAQGKRNKGKGKSKK